MKHKTMEDALYCDSSEFTVALDGPYSSLDGQQLTYVTAKVNQTGLWQTFVVADGDAPTLPPTEYDGPVDDEEAEL